MTSWKEERDRLVAQTLAFVQQVAAAHPAAASKLGIRSAPDHVRVETAAIKPLPEAMDLRQMIGEPLPDAPSVIIGSEQLPPPPPTNILADLPHRRSQYSTASERAEISNRVAAFKERQMRLNRERAAFYDNMQERIRSALRNDTDKAPL